MTIKIEKKGLTSSRDFRGNFQEFVTVVQRCKTGESFYMDKLGAQHRMALSIARQWLDATFRTAREGKGFRVARVG